MTVEELIGPQPPGSDTAAAAAEDGGADDDAGVCAAAADRVEMGKHKTRAAVQDTGLVSILSWTWRWDIHSVLHPWGPASFLMKQSIPSAPGRGRLKPSVPLYRHYLGFTQQHSCCMLCLIVASVWGAQ